MFPFSIPQLLASLVSTPSTNHPNSPTSSSNPASSSNPNSNPSPSPSPTPSQFRHRHRHRHRQRHQRHQRRHFHNHRPNSLSSRLDFTPSPSFISYSPRSTIVMPCLRPSSSSSSSLTSPSPASSPTPTPTPTSPSSSSPSGAYVLNSLWIPFDVWPRIAVHLTSVSDQIAFHSVCRVSRAAIMALHANRLRSVRLTFHPVTFSLPAHIRARILTAHPLPPPRRNALVLFLDAAGIAGGVDIAWLQHGMLRTAPLGLDSVPASSASNIVVSPDASRLACLVTLAASSSTTTTTTTTATNTSNTAANSTASVVTGSEDINNNNYSNQHQQQHVVTTTVANTDPLHRLRGWERVSRERGHVVDIVYDPCDDCTVQVVDLVPTKDGNPHALRVSTFSHVFVPEYGFDMVWRRDDDGHLELAFAAMLHSAAGAATYLVRWRGFDPIQPYTATATATDISSNNNNNSSSTSSSTPSSTTSTPSLTPEQQNEAAVVQRRRRTGNFVFMACIDGASAELLHDKRRAMLTQPSTTCTSRIELSKDARNVFFDTVSKFGILRFDQVEDASTTRVTRADLPNHTPPASPPRRAKRYDSSASASSSTHAAGSPRRTALRSLNVGNHDENRPLLSSSSSGSGGGGVGAQQRQQPEQDASGNSSHSSSGSGSGHRNSRSQHSSSHHHQRSHHHHRSSPHNTQGGGGMRISTMSSDGSLLCSLVCVPGGSTNSCTRHVEMRSSATGRLIYRRLVTWPCMQYQHYEEQQHHHHLRGVCRDYVHCNECTTNTLKQQQYRVDRPQRRSQQLIRYHHSRDYHRCWWRSSGTSSMIPPSSSSASASASASATSSWPWSSPASPSPSSPPSTTTSTTTTTSDDHYAKMIQSCVSQPYFSAPLDKSVDVARHAVSFSSDSTLLVVWDVQPHTSKNRLEFARRLPLVLDARTGRTVQDFANHYHCCCSSSGGVVYEFAQMAPDALTVYATRMTPPSSSGSTSSSSSSGVPQHVVMDAIDTVSGAIVKSIVTLVSRVTAPHSRGSVNNFVLDSQREDGEDEDDDDDDDDEDEEDGVRLHTVSRGWVDTLWQTTRGSVGCGWSGRRRLDEHEEYGDEHGERDGDGEEEHH